MKRIKAFSLTELLIALSIIGVVATLTISTVSTNYKKSTYVAGLKEISKTLSDTANLIAAENNGSLAGVFADSNAFMNSFANIIQPVKKCYATQDVDGCWHDEASDYTTLYGDAGPLDPDAGARMVIKNGMLLHFAIYSSSCEDNRYTINSVDSGCGEIIVDVNGFEKPNKFGRDIFIIGISRLGFYLDGEQDSAISDQNCDPSDSYWGWSGGGCGARIIREGGMKY